ncbi:GmrSD restriction endonuclease domain-containing protein [Streptomyces cyaneofuscatus]|uniref:GmrSD restriction endonuclease domain-containing protein n=1 Tax=Streptomyces cyaneofuscatus TaxID=66883 RepID=UPI0037A37352
MAALDNLKLRDVLADVASGALQLPDFQRNWKWDDDRIRAIIATVTLDYPLGVVMTLQTGGATRFRSRTLTGARPAGDPRADLLLLDGQQRLTSLFQALWLDAPVETSDSRGKPIERWYYVDIEKSVGPSADRDEAILSVPADKVLRTDFNRTVVLDLRTEEAECAAGLFPLHLVFDAQRVNQWKKGYIKADEERNWDRWGQFDDVVLQQVRAFQVPMIRLAASTSMDAVCAVFERVNTGGVPLNVFELLTATYAGDPEYVEQTGDYYQLPEAWREIKQAVASQYPVFGRLENGLENGLSSIDFLQAIALVRTWERKETGAGAAVSCKRRDLLDLPLTDFARLAPVLAEAFAWVGDFLERQCIVRPNDLPYKTQLVPLAAARAILGAAEWEGLVAQEKIEQWYWCGVLGEMYGGSTETRFTRDVEQLVDWIRQGDRAPDTVTDAFFFTERLDTLTTRNSAAYKGIYALLIKQGAVDWHYTESPLSPGRLDEYSVDVRQIFPKAWFRRGNSQGLPTNSIVNKTPLSYRATMDMLGAPSSYLSTLIAASDMRPEWFDDVVATHLIDPESLRESDYKRFYTDRSRQLQDLVQSSMGKPTMLRDLSEGDPR